MGEEKYYLITAITKFMLNCLKAPNFRLSKPIDVSRERKLIRKPEVIFGSVLSARQVAISV